MQITLHTPDTIYAPRHLPSWLLLTAAAGFVNGFAFLTSQQFVSHITGTVTRAGLEWPHAGLAAEYVAIFLSFVLGAAVAVVVLQLRARAGKHDRWATPLISVALILGGVAIAGDLGAFGRYGGGLAADAPPVTLLSVLAFAAGLQNASVAATTGMAVRTTHLTGPTTDLGMLLGAACLSTGVTRRSALGGAALRGGMVLAFMTGGFLSLVLAGRHGFLSLLAPAGLVLVAGVLSFIPGWSPSDFPFRAGGRTPPADPLAGLPADARPSKEELAAEAREQAAT